MPAAVVRTATARWPLWDAFSATPRVSAPAAGMGLPRVAEQIHEGIGRLKRRYAAERFVAYFQPGTNTYGPIDRLRADFNEAARASATSLVWPLAPGPTVSSEEVLDLLAELAERTWLVVEYGLQTIHDRTLDRLEPRPPFRRLPRRLPAHAATKPDIGVHVILGLPGESRDDMLATARELGRTRSALGQAAQLVRRAEHAAGRPGCRRPRFGFPNSRSTSAMLSISWRNCPADFVIERLCGDAPPEYLVGPPWCLDKAAVRAAVEAEFHRRAAPGRGPRPHLVASLFPPSPFSLLTRNFISPNSSPLLRFLSFPSSFSPTSFSFLLSLR